MPRSQRSVSAGEPRRTWLRWGRRQLRRHPATAATMRRQDPDQEPVAPERVVE